mmetsp:Transcript_29455/g.68162  ORF Transcript_29455/g.68162 Transcript_29455/m.68162 type:complete len:316 (+) Transcript_29455:1-948(+)
MQLLLINIIGKIGFDYEFTKTEQQLIFVSLAVTYQEYGIDSRRNPLRKHFPLFYPQVQRAREATQHLQLLCKTTLLSFRKNQAKQENGNKNEIKTLIECIVKDQEYNNDDERIRDLIVYLAAGFDTTSSTMAWTLLELAKNPVIQNWLRRNLLQTKKEGKGEEASVALKHVIRESMRLHLAGAITALRVLTDDVDVDVDVDTKLSDGTVIPKDSIVVVPSYAMHRDAQIFKDPDRFLPRRWENATPEMNQAWLGFGTGRRNCQGQALANAELVTVLGILCRDFQWTLVKEGTEQCAVTLKTIGTMLRATRIAIAT